MNVEAIFAPLRYYRIWLAAGVALVGSWIATPLALLAARISADGVALMFDPSAASRSVVQSVLTAIALAVAVEGSKAASLVWPMRRQWQDWMSLGAAYGVFQALGVLVGWAVDKARFGALIAPLSPMLLVLAVQLVILHWALGRLAAGAARPPGGPWLALFLATIASALISLLPLQPIVFLVRLPEAAFDAASWIKPALPFVFALAVWRWIPVTPPHEANGPARQIAVTLLGVVALLCLVVAASAAIFGPRESDPTTVLVAALGAVFVCRMVYRHVLVVWIRQPR